MHAKTFYRDYLASDEMFEIDNLVIEFINKLRPDNILDFGCGTGKNIKMLQALDPKRTVCGLDMSFLNIIYARAKHNLPFLIIGDEYHLCRLHHFDMAFTVSVLCHIQENIAYVIDELKRVAPTLVIAETKDVVGEFYYPHDYESYGFHEVGIQTMSGNGALYKIYQWHRQ